MSYQDKSSDIPLLFQCRVSHPVIQYSEFKILAQNSDPDFRKRSAPNKIGGPVEVQGAPCRKSRHPRQKTEVTADTEGRQNKKTNGSKDSSDKNKKSDSKTKTSENRSDENKEKEKEKERKCGGHEVVQRDKSAERQSKRRGVRAKTQEAQAKVSDNKIQQQQQQRPRLLRGMVVFTDKNQFSIQEMLGCGGFGEVYLVKELKTNKMYALKTEFPSKEPGMNRLKVEVEILQEIQNALPENKRHFTKFIDRGICNTPQFKFVVMSLVQGSIDSIRDSVLKGKDFSAPTAMRFSIQALRAIWDLHLLGYIHRDIKPSNFAVGIPPDDDTLFLLDFGIARRYVERRSMVLRVPREHVKFCGTIKYCSRTCHRKREQSRKDDLESWLYTCFEVFYANALPWRRLNRDEVLGLKENFFVNPDIYVPEMFKHVPVGFRRILRYINVISFIDPPDYEFITRSLDAIVEEEKIPLNNPFDWHEKLGKYIVKPKPEVEKLIEDPEDIFNQNNHKVVAQHSHHPNQHFGGGTSEDIHSQTAKWDPNKRQVNAHRKS